MKDHWKEINGHKYPAFQRAPLNLHCEISTPMLRGTSRCSPVVEASASTGRGRELYHATRRQKPESYTLRDIPYVSDSDYLTILLNHIFYWTTPQSSGTLSGITADMKQQKFIQACLQSKQNPPLKEAGQETKRIHGAPKFDTANRRPKERLKMKRHMPRSLVPRLTCRS